METSTVCIILCISLKSVTFLQTNEQRLTFYVKKVKKNDINL